MARRLHHVLRAATTPRLLTIANPATRRQVFKLAFARIVLAGRDMELAPRPFNLVRRLAELVMMLFTGLRQAALTARRVYQRRYSALQEGEEEEEEEGGRSSLHVEERSVVEEMRLFMVRARPPTAAMPSRPCRGSALVGDRRPVTSC